jgi:penicillin G amidase
MRFDSSVRSLVTLARRASQRRRRVERLDIMDALGSEVEIVTDGYGVPHISADTAHDLFFAQGFVTARDRLFQIDWARHGAAGRLCELVGRRRLPVGPAEGRRTTLDADVLLRTLGLAPLAEACLALHSQEAREALEAYAQGVNAFIEAGGASLEHRLLGVVPRPWGALDSLMLWRAVGFELNRAWRLILTNAMLGATGVPEETARLLWPHYAAGGGSERPAWEYLARELGADHRAAGVALGYGNAVGVGSNCFAVAASHTLERGALLANDMHSLLQVPGAWHEVALHGAGLELRGFALAGLPGVIVGRTPHGAWGATAANVVDLDLFVERRQQEDPERYLAPGGWRSLTAREERFVIRHETEQRHRLCESRHGPVLESSSGTVPAGQCIALAWTGREPGPDLDVFLGLWRARNLQDVDAALDLHVSPALNVTFAGADGRIACRLAGLLPRRAEDAPLRPLEGWSGEWDWCGRLPAAESPRQSDPPAGFLVTANGGAEPDSMACELGRLFESPERSARIATRLSELGDKITFEDLATLQLDTYSDWALKMRGLLLRAAGARRLNLQGRALQQSALELWRGWDGYATVDSVGATIGYATAWNAVGEVVRRLTGEEAADLYLELGAIVCGRVLELLEEGERLAELGVDLSEVARCAFERAIEQCQQAMGNNPADWRWGRLHTLTVTHRLGDRLLGRALSLGPVPASGGLETVNRGDFAGTSFRMMVGPSLRMVVSTGDPDAAGTVLPGGQAGERLSLHYDDQLPLFLAGRLKAAPLSQPRGKGLRQERWTPRV